MATLIEIVESLSPEQMREGESVVVETGRGEKVTLTFGPRRETSDGFSVDVQPTWTIRA